MILASVRSFRTVFLGVFALASPLGACTDDAVASVDAAVDAAPAIEPLGLNDVSVLFPLPADNAAFGYLAPTDEGDRGILLPRDVYDAIPGFPVTPAEGLIYARLRVVAARFDACGGGPSVCHPEIRLVMQPIVSGRARDSALHLFYRLDEAEMRSVVGGLRSLRELAPEASIDAPLDVHPALVAQGVDGDYGWGLRDLILAHAGADNLVRMTFFLRAPPVNEVWFLGGFERAAEALTEMDIVGVGAGTQRVIFTPSEDGYAYDLTPVGITPEDGSAFYSSAAAEAASEQARAEAMASYLRVENPSAHPVDDLPCAGCHIANFVRAEASRRFGLDLAAISDRFTSTRNLAQRGNAALTPSSLRAFGWFGTEPMIAQRTINESAAVLDDLEARFADAL